MKSLKRPIAVGWVPIFSAMLLLPTGAAAQAGIQLEITPVVSTGGDVGTLRSVPAETEDRGVVMRTGRTLGLGLQVGHTDLPFSLKLGGAFARGSLSYAATAMDVARAQGGNGGVFFVESVGSTSVKSLWADLVVEPFSWKVSPYALLGAMHRTTSYSRLNDDVADDFRSVDREFLMRFGGGANVELSDRTNLWFEAVRAMSPGAGSVGLGEFRPQEATSVLFGVKLRLF